MVHLADVFIFVFLIIFVLKAYGNGFLKEVVNFIGGVIIPIIAYMLKDYVAVYLYKYMPFMSLGGEYTGLSVINIIVYEFLAFILVTCVLLLIYLLILKVTYVLSKVTSTTIIKTPSKIMGGVIGIFEGIVFVFIFLFIFDQFPTTKQYIDNSIFGTNILENTPVLSDLTEPVYKSMQEINEVCKNCKDSTDKNQANIEALDIMLKYKIINYDNAKYLLEGGKLNLIGYESTLEKYNPANESAPTDASSQPAQ